jgi:hypothetical protein
MFTASIVLGIPILILIYFAYQLIRNHVVYKIRHRWIVTSDKRWYTYSYEFMLSPSKHNWYGIKYPHESLFP